ncbi:winged helix-turn-helix transcriptional regulator [Streptomyces sp. NPDC057579]|uniref:winged helix-turn-helix transcriptional regulator n=1 Tax=Streptomyces sp. NPDC057579 TaxID=3346172 RepID=UPI003695DB23
MATTGLPRTTLNDLSRVTETVEMLAPRWSAWALMTISSQPLRYAEIKSRLPWLRDGQLHPRLRTLTDAGVVERTEYTPRHVTYGLTTRGAELTPVLTVIAAWGDAHLEKDLVRNKTTGEMEPERIPTAQNVEDALTLISSRHATPILWTLRARGAATATTLAVEAMPGYGLPAVYKPLERLVADGLVAATGNGDFRLSANGQALAPVFQAVSAWAGGRPRAQAGTHPLWGQSPAPSQARSAPWATTQSRLPAPAAHTAPATTPALATTHPANAAWKSSDLFSHQIPARPISPAGGPRR